MKSLIFIMSLFVATSTYASPSGESEAVAKACVARAKRAVLAVEAANYGREGLEVRAVRDVQATDKAVTMKIVIARESNDPAVFFVRASGSFEPGYGGATCAVDQITRLSGF